MLSTNKPHSRYRHIYLVMRIDSYLPVEYACTCVSAWLTEALAEAEAERLNSSPKRTPLSTYHVTITRLKERIEDFLPLIEQDAS